MKKQIAKIGIVLALLSTLGCAKQPNYYGVVIGCCEDYANTGIKGLNAKKDAESFYNKLLSMYYGNNQNRAKGKLHLLTENSVTRRNVSNTLKSVAQKAKAGDVVYFFYSGHGSSLQDKSRLLAPAYENNELIKVMETSGLIVPYNFNLNQVGKTAIIGNRDLRDNGGYGFQYLDNKGVQVIMISDSCYSGNIFRNSNNSTRKFIPTTKLNLDFDAEIAKLNNQNSHRVKSENPYKKLIFFSAGGTDKAVGEDERLKRGKFSLVVEKCLKTANQNRDSIISKKEFQECLHTEDTAKAFVVYPTQNQQANTMVFKALKKNITVRQQDKIRVKTSIPNIESISNEVVLDNNNYDIEIVSIGKDLYQIYRYTGEEYAKVNYKDLRKYLNALKLFKLKGAGKLKAKVADTTYKRKEMGQFCKGEEFTVDVESQNRQYTVAITLDREGTVIMLQPNNQENFSSTLVRTRAKHPFGMDKVKIFTLTNREQYNQVKKLVVTGGLLEDYPINQLYTTLKRNKNFQETELDIETIDKSVNYCRQGD